MIHQIVDKMLEALQEGMKQSREKGDDAPFPSGVVAYASGEGVPEGFKIKITFEFVLDKPS